MPPPKSARPAVPPASPPPVSPPSPIPQTSPPSASSSLHSLPPPPPSPPPAPLSQSILFASSSNPDHSNAARNYLDHLSLSDRHLSAAALPWGRIADARAWTGAALLYNCSNALSYVSDTRPVANAMAFLSSLYNLTSNALSLIAALQRFDDDLSLWSPPQTERNGYWGDPAATAGSRSTVRIARFSFDLPTGTTVCQIGDCDYRTVQEAVTATPDFGAGWFMIRIKAGVYKETV